MLGRGPICALLILASVACVEAARAGSADVPPKAHTILLAQNFSPPGSIPGGDQGYGGGGAGYGAPAGGSGDAASLLVRIDHLENQVRSLNGQIEQLQYNQRRLEGLLQKSQQDADMRFQDAARKGGATGSSPRSQAAASLPADAAAGDSGQTAGVDAPDVGGSARARRDDAFDPGAHPDAPGAPHALGGLPSSDAGGGDPNAPLQLDNGPGPVGGGAPSSDRGAANQSAALGAGALGGGALGGGTTPAIAGAPSNDPREDFDLALVSFNNGQFAQAQTAFQGFLTRHPKDRLTGEAVFYLGESYWRLGRTREAAEQYLKISTNYAKSPHAPESLLKLGLSLEKLGSKDQACASWSEIARKYPNASASVRASAQREMKRDQCGA